MRFLPGIKPLLSWATFGGRKFVLIAGTMIWLAYCTQNSVKVDQSTLDFIWKLIGVYCTANVGKSGVDWMVAKLKGVQPADAVERAELIASLEAALAKAKAGP